MNVIKGNQWLPKEMEFIALMCVSLSIAHGNRIGVWYK